MLGRSAGRVLLLHRVDHDVDKAAGKGGGKSRRPM